MSYKIVIVDSYDGIIETIVPDYDDVVEIVLLLCDSKSYKLKEISQCENYQPERDVIEILKEDSKPNDLETNQRRKR